MRISTRRQLLRAVFRSTGIARKQRKADDLSSDIFDSAQQLRGDAVSLPMTLAKRAGRTLLLLLFAAAGTILLVRFAPGFFSDSREMDAKYALAAQAEIQQENRRQQSVGRIAMQEAKSWLSGDFGDSRQYHVPVAQLIGSRVRVSALLLAQGILRGWLVALCAALPISALRKGAFLWRLPFTL